MISSRNVIEHFNELYIKFYLKSPKYEFFNFIEYFAVFFICAPNESEELNWQLIYWSEDIVILLCVYLLYVYINILLYTYKYYNIL